MNLLRLLGLGAVGVAMVSTAAAADPGAPARVARVADVSGTVEQRDGAGDWTAAAVNLPAFVDTALRSATSGRAMLDFGAARVALAPTGEIRIADLRPGSIAITLVHGRIGVRLGAADTRQAVEIDLPQGAVWLGAPGDYDIAAGEHMPSRIAVFAGAAEFAAPGIHTNIIPGGLALVEDSDPVTVTTTASAVPDGFTDWWRAAPQAAETVPLPPSVAGAAALAGNGDWQTTADYGVAWYPKAGGDWTPFREGRWSWVEPGGWTWVDDAAWGFAPSHYGSWVRIDDRWAWVPGKADEAAVYAPATVAFLGTPGIGVSYAGGFGPAIGWFPLGPGESLDPDGAADFRNRRFASIVPRAVFVGGKPVTPALLSLPEQRLDDAPVILGALGITPQASKPPEPRPVKTAAAKPATPHPSKVVAAARPPSEIGRKRALARMKQVLANAAHRTARTALHHTAPSTASRKAAHNRQHLAAARGGAP